MSNTRGYQILGVCQNYFCDFRHLRNDICRTEFHHFIIQKTSEQILSNISLFSHIDERPTMEQPSMEFLLQYFAGAILVVLLLMFIGIVIGLNAIITLLDKHRK
jgi:hypothetical protein